MGRRSNHSLFSPFHSLSLVHSSTVSAQLIKMFLFKLNKPTLNLMMNQNEYDFYLRRRSRYSHECLHLQEAASIQGWHGQWLDPISLGPGFGALSVVPSCSARLEQVPSLSHGAEHRSDVNTKIEQRQTLSLTSSLTSTTSDAPSWTKPSMQGLACHDKLKANFKPYRD